MKILQHGRPPKSAVKRFQCDSCGCVFEAEKSEYKSEFWRNEIYYHCTCPECGKDAAESPMPAAGT